MRINLDLSKVGKIISDAHFENVLSFPGLLQCVYLLEASQVRTSNEYPQHVYMEKYGNNIYWLKRSYEELC